MMSMSNKITGDIAITIRRYEAQDENKLFSLIEHEGDEWQDYWKGENRTQYHKALSGSVVYLLFTGKKLCGFVRCRDDDGYGVYIYDLLVDQEHRGNEYGRLLMERVFCDFPDVAVYVMSDVNPYYEKLGYEKVGSIFLVKPSGK